MVGSGSKGARDRYDASRRARRADKSATLFSMPSAPDISVATATATALLLTLWLWRRTRRGESSIGEVPLTPRRHSLLSLRDAMALRSALRSRMGLDIGGTLAKIAIASEPGKNPFAHVQMTTATPFPHLDFEEEDGAASIHFISVPTHLLEATAKSIRQRMSYPAGTEDIRPIVAAGGGAHRFKKMFREVLDVELLPFKELQAVVHGILFLQAHGPRDELFTINSSKRPINVPWPGTLFPFLLVNMGSGVSVQRVSGPEDFKRVGGTACGGATFLGLGRALVGCSDFDELMELASKGDESRVDKSVGDIYGESGCVDLGMPAKLTAASFGRLATERLEASSCKADLVRALLRMVVQASVVLAKAYAQSDEDSGMLDRIFFVGGFVGAEGNVLARQLIAESMSNVGGRALFCRHAEFLGSLGSLQDCLHRHREAIVEGELGGEERARYSFTQVTPFG